MLATAAPLRLVRNRWGFREELTAHAGGERRGNQKDPARDRWGAARGVLAGGSYVLAAGLRVLQVALAVACMFLLYATVVPLVSRSAVPESTLPELDLTATGAKELASLQVIQTRNLFATPETAEGLGAASAGELLEESTLRFELRGTAAAEAAEASVAVLVDPSQAESFVVRVGDKLGSTGVEVERIERGRIVVVNRGKREQISLVEEEDNAAAAGLGRAVARPARTNSAANRAQLIGERGRARALQTEQLRNIRQSQASGGGSAPRSRPSRSGSDDMSAPPAAPEPAVAEPTDPSGQPPRGDPSDPIFQSQPRVPEFPPITPGERITAVSGVVLERPTDLQEAIRSGPPWVFTILNEQTGATREVTVAE